MSEAASDLPELTEDERREYEPDMDCCMSCRSISFRLISPA